MKSVHKIKLFFLEKLQNLYCIILWLKNIVLKVKKFQFKILKLITLKSKISVKLILIHKIIFQITWFSTSVKRSVQNVSRQNASFCGKNHGTRCNKSYNFEFLTSRTYLKKYYMEIKEKINHKISTQYIK